MRMFRPADLHEPVHALWQSGRLHLFDAEWISRLPAGAQLAAAEKCMRDFNVTGAVGWGPVRTPMSQSGNRGGRA